MPKLKSLAPWGGLGLLLVVAWLAYHPGLSGGFLFDDFVNLDALGSTGPVDNWRTFWRFVTSGIADPTGRPLALLSFLVDARDWPADPAPFLRTNVLLHLINGALLFALLRSLGRRLGTPAARNDAVALLASGMWLLHPLFVSTTLYIVQREAMLPTTMVLLGLLAYAHGRNCFDQSPGRGIAWMTGGIVGGTVLAVLCKGNGVLLPLLAWVLEATVLAGGPIATDHRLARIKAVLLVVPSLCLMLYVAHFLTWWNAPLGTRPWTVGERVLTEPRVLFDYLKLLVVPRSVSTGLYNDAYAVSTGLLRPPVTLLAVLGLIALFASGLLTRRRWPLYSAGVLFFLAGHLLESSTIPIELYFEHRNYLPAMLLAWPLADALCTWKVARPLRVAAAMALLLLLAATTYQRSVLWGHPERLANLWVRQNPDSSRAQASAAIAELQAGRADHALARLEPLWRQRPYDLQIAFNVVDAACATRGLDAHDTQAVAAALRYGPQSQLLMYTWLARSIEVAASHACSGLELDDVAIWLRAALDNPANDVHVRDLDIEPLLGQLAMRQGHADAALAHFNRALAALPKPDVAARQASMLAANGDYTQALAHLDAYERLKARLPPPTAGMPWLHAKVLEWQGYWPFEMALLRRKLHAAIDESDDAPHASAPPPVAGSASAK